MRFHAGYLRKHLQASQPDTFWLTIQSIYGYFTESLFVTRRLRVHTQSFHKMRSTALVSLIFTLFTLLPSGLLFRSTDNLSDFFWQLLRMLRRLLLKER